MATLSVAQRAELVDKVATWLVLVKGGYEE
jgi:hypothetical protein